jgi:hypothetical protein
VSKDYKTKAKYEEENLPGRAGRVQHTAFLQLTNGIWRADNSEGPPTLRGLSPSPATALMGYSCRGDFVQDF